MVKQGIFQSFQIKKVWPSKLIITVQEREIIGSIAFTKGFAYIDEDIYVIKIEEECNSIPIITGINLQNIVIGQALLLYDTYTEIG
jgi:cell division septal protein FtsQ